MDTALRELLAELEEYGRRDETERPEYARRMLNLEPETAHLVSVLVRLGRRTRILEIGTSNGYSTLWLAWSARATGGRVTSVDRQAWKQQLAEENLRRAGLRDLVELRCGDAAEVVHDLAGPFDLVFFDADRTTAPAQLEILLPKLADDALLLADNALSHPDEIAAYLAAVARLPDFEHVVVPVGKGLSLAHRGDVRRS